MKVERTCRRVGGDRHARSSRCAELENVGHTVLVPIGRLDASGDARRGIRWPHDRDHGRLRPNRGSGRLEIRAVVQRHQRLIAKIRNP